MATVMYLDTSAVLRAVLETGTSPDLEHRMNDAAVLITSRLGIVEAARAVLRLRQRAQVPETRLADVSRDLDALWARCDVWELSSPVCDLAATVAPTKPLRALDALHLATYLLVRRALGEVELLTADERLYDAAQSV